jgi:ribosomal protein S18 acetylase RimI-like enzyme
MPSDITWREDPIVDLDQLAALFRAVGFRRSTEHDVLAAMVAGSRWVVSAWEGTRLVGFARAISDGVSNAYVSTVAVLPSHQRRGIGRGLMERLLADKPTVKWVVHTSDAGEGLYREHGFVDATRMLVRARDAERG